MKRLPKGVLTAFIIATLAGACLHFLYTLLPCGLTAAIAPVNESLWEHVKILYWPGLAAGLILARREPEHLGARMFCLLLAAAVMLGAGWIFHVTLEGQSLFFDVVLYVVVMAICLLLPALLCRPFWARTRRLWTALAAALGAATVLFTWLTPRGLLFADLSLASFAPIPW